MQSDFNFFLIFFRFPCVAPDADPVVDSSEVKENEAP